MPSNRAWMTPASRMGGATPPMAAPGLPGLSNGSPIVSSQAGGMDPLSQTLLTLSMNPYIIGVFILLLNLGGRFLALELTKQQEEFLKSSWIRPVIFFAVTYIATRNLAAAFWMTLGLFFVLWVATNENSAFCMIPSWHAARAEDAKKAHDQYIQNIHAPRPLIEIDNH
jgi:hypothetical protein